MRHEIVTSNPDVDVRFYLSKDEGSYVSPHWHNSLEIVYVIKGKVVLNLPRGVKVTASDGEFFMANPREIHSVLAEKNEALVLQIPQRFYDKYVPSMHQRSFFIVKRLACARRFLLICIRGMRLKEQNLNG